MRQKIILMFPVLLAVMLVGYMLSRNYATDDGIAAEITVTTGAATEAASGVPSDIYYSGKIDAVAFSHKKHAIEQGFECKVCHTNIFQMKAHTAEAQPDFNMAGLAEGKYCGTCHSAKTDTAFASDTQCARCHLGVKGLERETESVTNT